MIETYPKNKSIKTYFFLILIFFFLASTAMVQAQDYKSVVAENGDGIYSLLRKHGIPANYVDEFIALNKDQLKESKQLITGNKYKLPLVKEKTTPSKNSEPSPTTAATTSNKPTRIFTIFGKKHEEVEIVDNELTGAVYYLVSGHGGPDPGAVSYYNHKMLCEDEYAYDITLRLARELLSHNATVYMITRDNNDGIRDGWYLRADKDEKCYPNLTIPINQTKRLCQRKDAVNKLYKKYKGRYQRLVVIHLDSRSKGEKIDVFFYHDKRSKAGEKLCENLRNTFDVKYNTHQPGRGYHGTVSDRNLYMLKYSWPVATFIELGNIQHERDVKRFIIESNRQALAKWLSEGLMLDFDNNK